MALLVASGHGSASPATPRPKAWCRARSSLSWRRALARHVVPLSRTTALVPWTLAHDGRSFFATVYSRRFSGVARISALSSRITQIKPFPNAAHDQADGAFDGRWLVWNEYHSLTGFDDFTTWAWDADSGRVRRLGAAARAPDGEFWPSPWRAPDVRDGFATWVQGTGPDGLTAVHLYELRTGRDSIVRRGHAQGSFFVSGHRVAWPESRSRDAATRISVASALTGRPIPAPRALRELRGISGLATDGHRIAYPTASYKALWWAPSLAGRAREIVAASGYEHVDNSVQIGGHYVGFGIQPRVFFGDTDTRRYVLITPSGGWTRIDARSLLVLYATPSDGPNAAARIVFVPLRDLPPIPRCR
jgi:hypothetical protein